MLRMAIVSNVPYSHISGGISRFLKEVAPRLAKSFQVKLLVTGDSEKIEVERPSPSFEIHHFPCFNLPIGDTRAAKFYPKVLKSLFKDCDLIFIQGINCFWPMIFALRMKKPVVMYFHTITWETYSKNISNKFLQNAFSTFMKRSSGLLLNRLKGLILPASEMEDMIKASHPKINTFLAPLGVDCQFFTPPKSKQNAKQAIGLSDDDLVLGYVGRLAKEKNIQLLLEMFSSLQRSFSSLKLLLVGSGIKEFDPILRSNPGIISVGQKEDVRPFFQAMDVFCMPSESETTSLASMEAMASGVPVVCYPTGCQKEYVEHAKNGYLAPLGNGAELEKLLKKLLTERPTRERFGIEARNFIAHRAGWEDCVEKMASAFHEILGIEEIPDMSALPTTAHFLETVDS